MGAANRPRTSWAARCLASSSGSMEPGVLTEWMAFSARIMGARRRSSFSGFSALAIFSGLAAFSWRLSCFFSLAVRRMVCFFSSMVRLPSPAEAGRVKSFILYHACGKKGTALPCHFLQIFGTGRKLSGIFFLLHAVFLASLPALCYTIRYLRSLRSGPVRPAP